MYRCRALGGHLGLTVVHLFKAYVHPYFSDFEINKSKVFDTRTLFPFFASKILENNAAL